MTFRKLITYLFKECSRNNSDIFRYGITVGLINCVIWSIIFGISYFWGNFEETIYFFMAYLLLRKVIGGYHASNVVNCLVLTTGVYAFFSVLAYVLSPMIYSVLDICIVCISLICITYYAPYDYGRKINCKYEREKYRRKGLMMWSAETGVVIVLLSVNPYSIKANAISLGMAMAVLFMLIGRLKQKALKTFNGVPSELLLFKMNDRHGILLSSLATFFALLSINCICNGPFFEMTMPEKLFEIKKQYHKGGEYNDNQDVERTNYLN